MKKVSILATEETIATTVLGPMDVFFLAGRLWNVIYNTPITPLFEVEVVAEKNGAIKCLNNVLIQPHKTIQDVKKTDLIIISSITDRRRKPGYNLKTVRWLKNQHRRGASIASVCTGAFLLAETGLLDGKTATTHWGFIDLFRERYPKVNLQPEKLITDEGTLYCAGALSAGIDLSIYLVEKYCGHDVAIQCSKALLHDMGRQTQAPFSVLQFQKRHGDEAVLAVQLWLEENLEKPVDMNHLAHDHAMSRRTFERRFKKATGDTPLFYLQKIRVEAAKKMIEMENVTFDEISHRAGYENSGHFREIFKRHTGLLPTQYERYFRQD
ncbi:MAG: helix-turn-helix domain-containing protein [Deltaproteobacteria bacterium]|nr:helix-turn-helix domain-containing protein [Deltaproteobacteria bacterium]